MKTPAKLAIALLGIATVYSATSWYTGTRIEAFLDVYYAKTDDMFKELPKIMYTIDNRKFDRGIFSSTDTVTFSTTDSEILALANALKNTDDGESLKITVRTQYQHGPFADGTFAVAAVSGFDVVRAESSASVGKLLERFDQLFAGKRPFEMRSVFYFDGNNYSIFKVSAFELELPGEKTDKEPLRISWDNFDIEGTAPVDLSRFSYKGKLPRLTLTHGADNIKIAGLALESNQERLFENNYMLLSGPTKFSMDELDISLNDKKNEGVAEEDDENEDDDPLAHLPIDIHLKQFAFDADVSAKDDFIDMAVRTGIESLKVSGQDFGPAHYDISFKHLHGTTLNRLWLDYIKMANILNAGDRKSLREAREAVTRSGSELLTHDPVFSLDRFSFTTPEGEPRLSARVAFKGVKPEDIANPFGFPLGLIPRIDANGELSVPVALVDKYAEIVGIHSAILIDPLVNNGFITLENGILKTTATFRETQLKLNGKLFDPNALRE
jgi:uncharacterized protein YdgA (DUF945 family)